MSNKKKQNWFKRLPNNTKGFFKELKRVRWLKSEESGKMFRNTLIFVIIASLVLFLITYGFTNLWTVMGVGVK